ncbi:hypothetical protein QTP88_015729 [Uroleucon formosanum]
MIRNHGYLHKKLYYAVVGSLHFGSQYIPTFPTPLISNYLLLFFALRKSLSEMDKVTVISFDETYVSQKYCYNKKTEQVLGPFKCLQVMTARGLFSKWKQPLYYNYDSPMTQLLLFDIISQLYVCGFEVAAVVSDMGPTNIRLWKSHQQRHHLVILYLENKFMFADVPQLLKLVRNHFIDIIQEVVSLNKGDLSCVRKVTDRHLNAIGSQRQNGKLATQVLSNSMAKAISYLGQKNLLQFTNWKEASTVIKLFNNWFDLSNTQLPKDKFTLSYALDIDDQNKILSEMNTFIESLRVHSKGKQTTSLKPFQKGILIINTSLKLMFEDLKERYPDIKYILTRRINQDLLENLFSALKKNRNTECSAEECLVNCLSAVTINQAEVNNNNNMDECRQVYFNEKIAKIESNFESTETFDIPKKNINLLIQYASYVNPVNELTELVKDCIEYITEYVASHYATEYPWLCNKEVCGSS